MSSSAQTQPRQPSPTEHLMQFAGGYWPSVSLYIVAKLGIADLLKGGPRPVAELAAATATNADALYRVLRALASVGIFTETAPRVFALTPPAEPLRSDIPGSLRAMVQWIADPFHLRVYAEMMHSVKTGQPAMEHVFGKPAFEYLETDPEEMEVFHAAMTSFSAYAVPAILEAYDFSSIETLIDLGGGHGFLLTSILQKYPALKGILFDMEKVYHGRRTAVEECGMTSRCQVVSGDFFAGVPTGGDAFIMKHIIHDWDDDKATLILSNCRKALAGKPKAKVLVVDAIVPPANEPHFAKFLDLEMLVIPGGRERTEEEFRRLFANAELKLTRIIPTKSPVAIIEGVPA